MSFQTINPATGETLRTFPMASDAEVATALKTADDRYNNDWKLRPVAARAQIVKRAAILVRTSGEPMIIPLPRTPSFRLIQGHQASFEPSATLAMCLPFRRAALISALKP